MEIRKGHFYIADLNPRAGTEPGKLRPVVVVQTDFLNREHHPSTIICPVTTKIVDHGFPLRLRISTGESQLKQVSEIMIDQIRAIDNRRFKKYLGMLSQDNFEKLQRQLKLILL